MPYRISTADPEIGRLIAHHRKRKGIRQAEVAALIGVSASQYGRYELGQEYVSLERRRKIAEVLGLDPVLFADPSLMEVTADERALIEDYRQIGTPAVRRRVRAQIGNCRRAPSC